MLAANHFLTMRAVARHLPGCAMIRFNCPSCGKRLKFPPEYAGRSVKCPKCGASISPTSGDDAGHDDVEVELVEVPAVVPPPPILQSDTAFVMPEPVQVPHESRHDPRFDLSPEPEVIQRKRTSSTTGVQWWHLLVGVALAGAVTAGVLWIIERNDGRIPSATGEPDVAVGEHERDVLTYLMVLNRHKVAIEEASFWLEKARDQNVMDFLNGEMARLDAQATATQVAMDSKWPKRRKLSKERLAESDRFSAASSKITRLRLEESLRQLETECESTHLALSAEIPVGKPVPPKVDRSTPEGEREYQTFLMLLPQLEKVERANRDLKVAEMYDQRLPNIRMKWVKYTRSENAKNVADLEKSAFGFSPP